MMTKVYQNVLGLIGNTPNIAFKPNKDKSQIYAKLECFNPSGNITDRQATSIIEYALASGQLKVGGTLLHAGNGALSLSLAMVGAAIGINCVVVLPQYEYDFWNSLISCFDTRVLQVDGDLEQAKQKVDVLARSLYRGAYVANTAGCDVLFSASFAVGQEVFKEHAGNIDCVVVPIKLGNTIGGISRFFETKKNLISTQVVGVAIQNDTESQVILKQSDIVVSQEQAYDAAVEYTRNSGIKVGILSGGAIVASDIMAQNLGYKKNIVAIFSDSWRY
jgi:cysteine synthase A